MPCTHSYSEKPSCTARVSDHPSDHGSTESTSNSEVNIELIDVTDVTPVAKCKKQSKFMELLSDVMSSAATSSADKTCEENAKFELQWYVDDAFYDRCKSTINPPR